MDLRKLDLSGKMHQWTDGRFLMRSGYYAGRGPRQDDLNSRILEMIYQGLLKDAGPIIAANFVRFVNNLNDMSASAFIVAFERFCGANGLVTDLPQDPKDRDRLSGYGSTLHAEAFGLMAQKLSGGKQSENEIELFSYSIKREFIRGHRAEIPPNEIRKEKSQFADYASRC